MDTFDVKTHTEWCWTEYNPFNSTCPSTVKIYILFVLYSFVDRWNTASSLFQWLLVLRFISPRYRVSLRQFYWYQNTFPMFSNWRMNRTICGHCGFSYMSKIARYALKFSQISFASFSSHLFTMILFQSTNMCVQAFIDRSLSFPRVCWVAVAIFRILLWVQEILDIS